MSLWPIAWAAFAASIASYAIVNSHEVTVRMHDCLALGKLLVDGVCR